MQPPWAELELEPEARRSFPPRARPAPWGRAISVEGRARPAGGALTSRAATTSSNCRINFLFESVEDQRRVGQARVARALAEKGFLARGLTEAEARGIVYALMSIDTYRILRLEQHWSGARYERWLASALHRLLVEPIAT